MTGIPVCFSQSDQKGTTLLVPGFSGQVGSGDLLSKVVVVINVLGESAVEEGDLKLISHEVHGQVVEVGEVTWRLCLPWSTGTFWGTVGANADGGSGFQDV